MAQLMSWKAQNVASVAGRVLFAFKHQPDQGLRAEVARAQRFFDTTRRLDELEAEKLDVLRGAIESLDCPRPEKVRAAVYLLEHLASHPA